jgi:hypothetical protein
MIVHFITDTYMFISLTEMEILYRLSTRDPLKFSKRWKLTLYQNHPSYTFTIYSQPGCRGMTFTLIQVGGLRWFYMSLCGFWSQTSSERKK